MSENYLSFPHINPVIFYVGPVTLHWYGLMYFISFIFVRWLARRRISCSPRIWTKEDIDLLLYISFFGVFFGGRLGYVLFYNLPFFLDHPIDIFKVWNGGMSFHGGLIGVVLAILVFSYRTKRHFLQVSDFIAPMIPFGLGAGRLGNYINGELWGRVNPDLPWSMLFPGSQSADISLIQIHEEWKNLLVTYGSLPRHPSQLYEMGLEGVLLFIILNLFVISRSRPLGSVSGLFLISYSVLRIISEFFREPDSQLGLYYGISMGQILSIPMMIVGIIIIIRSYRYYLFTNHD
ncbi:prolipoprotein diacylglyceryl transferase [Candidatus Erwinia haradaeae]|uniref:Phosphatidylglycerol--prolipoprotein diacylglyceryl transferase n=1 Tax=Candidatus Erwinia haradaeae TaxID=1922217 RepID=A0A803FTL2_9GAMM|nr:prolipoprotein diacylglyceryl transferase [Candidatus Erwinia haradaeae]VFP87093.1 Prolipoprotein diacylglyceryl transferase [Candidatus Erwinia haradaeae]